MKRFVNAKLLDQVFDVGALKVNQLWRMREAVSNVFNEAKIVPMLAYDAIPSASRVPNDRPDAPSK